MNYELVFIMYIIDNLIDFIGTAKEGIHRDGTLISLGRLLHWFQVNADLGDDQIDGPGCRALDVNGITRFQKP